MEIDVPMVLEGMEIVQNLNSYNLKKKTIFSFSPKGSHVNENENKRHRGTLTPCLVTCQIGIS